jgi:DNA-binding CsgD family transcriptional regulator
MEGRRKTFTTRQLQVIELIAAGCSNEEIGKRLGISARTAKAHSDALRRKLGVAKKRQIPAAYRLVTGKDPLDQLPAALGARPPALTLVRDPSEVVVL